MRAQWGYRLGRVRKIKRSDAHGSSDVRSLRRVGHIRYSRNKPLILSTPRGFPSARCRETQIATTQPLRTTRPTIFGRTCATSIWLRWAVFGDFIAPCGPIRKVASLFLTIPARIAELLAGRNCAVARRVGRERLFPYVSELGRPVVVAGQPGCTSTLTRTSGPR
jgi:hypothetical protein